MKRSGSSVEPDTYDCVPGGRSRWFAPPASQSELNGLAATSCLVRAGAGRLEVAPVPELLEGMRGGVDRRLAVMCGDELHADRQTRRQAAGNVHRRMAADIERRRVGQHLERALAVERE